MPYSFRQSKLAADSSSPAVIAAFVCMMPLLAGAGCQEATTDAATAGTASVVDPSLVSQRGALQFFEGWELGQRVAAERNLPRLVFFTAHWCTYCRTMEATTFADAQIGQLGREFVCVLVDADREPGICRRLQVTGYPTVHILGPSGTPLAELRGWSSAPQLADALRAALDRHALLERAATMR